MDWTSVVTAVATAVSAAVLLAAVIIAVLQVKEARRLRHAQIRPFVVLDLDAQSEAPLIYLTISNLGNVMARDVRFQFAPRLSSTFDDGRLPDVADLSILTKGIPTLPPGKKISFLFDSAMARYKAKADHADRYDVRVKYVGESGQSYADTMALDLEPYWNLSHVERRKVHDLHERLKEIRDVMKKWTASFDGLLVMSPEDVRRRHEEFLGQVAKERAAGVESDEEGEGE